MTKPAKLRVEHWPLSKLTPYANNPRDNDSAVDRMVASIKKFGFRIPIIVQASGEVVDGHLRLKAAHRLSLETVPVTLADELTPAEIKAFRLTANHSANWATWNAEMLATELGDLEEVEFNISQFGLDDILPELEAESDTATPRSPRKKTTIFVSVPNAVADKARTLIATALKKANIEHNL